MYSAYYKGGPLEIIVIILPAIECLVGKDDGLE